jgi:hypothetical protein
MLDLTDEHVIAFEGIGYVDYLDRFCHFFVKDLGAGRVVVEFDTTFSPDEFSVTPGRSLILIQVHAGSGPACCTNENIDALLGVNFKITVGIHQAANCTGFGRSVAQEP